MPKRPASPRLLLGERDLGVDLLAVAPGGGQALEGGAVVEAGLGEALVEVVDLERLGALRAARRPGARRRPAASRGERRRWRGGSTPPLAVAVLRRGSGSRARGCPASSGARTDDLQLHRPAARAGSAAPAGSAPRRVSAPTSLAGPQRQLDEGGAGQEHGAGDGVVGQPGVGRRARGGR